MNLLYLVFGPEFKNHLQAYFSILSFFAGKFQGSIHIVTDMPAMYEGLKGPQVHIHPLDAGTMREWQGGYGFFWRVKIKAFQFIINRYPDQAWVYLDSDTFLIRDVLALEAILSKGDAVMHLREGRLAKLTSKTEALMWKQCRGKTFGSVTIHQDHSMWNAGVIGIPAENAGSLIAGVLQVCDEMCAAGVTRRLIEQFSFSVILEEKTTLLPADHFIGHYWSNKEMWNRMISEFFMIAWMEKLTMEDIIHRFMQLNFKKIPVHLHVPNTQRRMHRLADRWFPAKVVWSVPD